MKRLLKTTLHACGYEITRLETTGRSPTRDIRTMFRGAPLNVVFDVGANEGQTAIDFATAFPEAEIHCFEPYTEAFERLKKAVSRFTHIKTVRSALGDIVGEQVLCLNTSSVTNSLLPNAPEAYIFQPCGMATPVGTTPVPTVTLDRYCSEHDINMIDVLKMDTQGYELRVLRGAEQLIRNNRIAVVFAEMLFAPLYTGQAFFHEVYAYLWSWGFRLVNLYNVMLNAQNYASWCDALFVQPAVLERRTALRSVSEDCSATSTCVAS